MGIPGLDRLTPPENEAVSKRSKKLTELVVHPRTTLRGPIRSFRPAVSVVCCNVRFVRMKPRNRTKERSGNLGAGLPGGRMTYVSYQEIWEQLFPPFVKTCREVCTYKLLQGNLMAGNSNEVRPFSRCVRPERCRIVAIKMAEKSRRPGRIRSRLAEKGHRSGRMMSVSWFDIECRVSGAGDAKRNRKR